MAKAVAAMVKGKMVELAEQIVGCLKLISLGESIVIGATDGRGFTHLVSPLVRAE